MSPPPGLQTSSQAFDPVYRRLQRHLDQFPIGFPATESGVELRLLAHVYTLLDANIALSLTLLPSSAKQVWRRVQKRSEMREFNLSQEQVAARLKVMADKGGLMWSQQGSTPTYANAMLAIGMFEFQGDLITEEFARDMLQYMDEGFREAFFEQSPLQLRPVPTKGLLTPEFPVARYDDIRAIVDSVPGPITVMNCVCKVSQDLLGHPCHNTDERMWCMTLSYDKGQKELLPDPMHLERKILSKPEVLGLLDRAEQAGLVVQPSNSLKPIFICLCCGDCCGVLTEAKKLAKPAQFFQNNYLVELDVDKCVSCGLCVSRCQMDAISQPEPKTPVSVDFDRCIGCGLCVTSCNAHALQLQLVANPKSPPRDSTRLYLKILEGKMGRLPAYRMLFRQLLGSPPK